MADSADPTGVPTQAETLLCQIWAALGGTATLPAAVGFTAHGDLPSVFAVSDLAAGVVAAAGLAVAELIAACKGAAPAVQATIGGHTPIAFTALPSSLAAIQAGQVRAIGVAATERAELLRILQKLVEKNGLKSSPVD